MTAIRWSIVLATMGVAGCGAETPLYPMSDMPTQESEEFVYLPRAPSEIILANDQDVVIHFDEVVVEFTQLTDPEVTLAPDQVPEFTFEVLVGSGELVIEAVNMYLVALLPGPNTSMWLGTLAQPADLWADDAETNIRFDPITPDYVTDERVPWHWISDTASEVHSTGFPGIPIFTGETVRIKFSLSGYEDPFHPTSFMLCPAITWRNTHEAQTHHLFSLFPETQNSQTGCSGTIFHTP